MYYILKGRFENCIKFDDNSGVVWLIPISENNADYQQYLKWVAEGNTAEEITE